MKVTLICADKNSGKTTFAKKIISEDKNSFFGFLSFSSANKNSYYLHEIENEENILLMSDKVNNDYERIGRFYIEPYAFDKAYELILKKINESKTKKCVVIDEVGKLELDGFGFDKLIKHLIDIDMDLLLCVRASFVSDVILKYGFSDYTIIKVPKIN